MLGLSFFLSLDWCSYIISIAKIVPKKTGALTSYTTFLLKLPFISTNLPFGLAWNTGAPNCSGPILESKGMCAIFSEKGQKRANNMFKKSKKVQNI